MVTTDDRPDAGGNTEQPDDGRDEQGRLPEPLDSAHYPPVDGGPAIVTPGLPLSQPAGTGPVISTPPPEPEPEAEPEPELTPKEAKAQAKAEAAEEKAEASKGGMTTMPRAGG